MKSRRLVIMRHANATRPGAFADDHGRELTPTGTANARYIGQELARLGWQPDAVFHSDATRCVTTWEWVKESLSTPQRVLATRDLYESGSVALPALASRCDDKVTTVLFLGHNPGLQHCVFRLCERSIGLTPATAVLLEVNADSWDEAIAVDGHWRLVEVLRPEQ